MAAAPRDNLRGENLMLRTLYEAGEYSDLTIRTSTRDFKVHRCIVCSKSGFFKGASRGGFQEAQSGVVQVEERAEVVDALLKHMYQVPQDFVPRKEDSPDQLVEKAGMDAFNLALEVRTAADMYLIEGLQDATERTFGNCIDFASTEEAATMGMELLQSFDGVNLRMQTATLFLLAPFIEDIANSEEAWTTLCAGEPQHSRNLVKAGMARSRLQHSGYKLLDWCRGQVDADKETIRDWQKWPILEPGTWKLNDNDVHLLKHY